METFRTLVNVIDIYNSEIGLCKFQSDWTCWTKSQRRGTWVAQWVKPLPSAPVVIPESWDQALHRALCSAGSLLPPLSLPASLPTCDLSLSLSVK